jgi:ribosomal protein S18 acetylase RimI-like enzyme
MNNKLAIVKSELEDIDIIFDLYNLATIYQKMLTKKHWKGFERKLVETEIKEQRQFKIVMQEQIVCVFVVTFSDPYIWQQKGIEPAIYVHRIATHPDYRGNGFVMDIVNWAKEYAIEKRVKFIRLDTTSGNDRLTNYYIRCGFTYLGNQECILTDELPAHYKDGPFSLFEIKLS